MLPMSPAEIAATVSGRLVDGHPSDPLSVERAVRGPVVVDSREAVPGALFAALPGTRSDGHEHVADAVARGAVAVLAERPVPPPGVPLVLVPDTRAALGHLAREQRRRLTGCAVVGVTGSAGKTTTKDLLAQILAAHGPTVANRLSFNNEIGLPLTLLAADADTRALVLEMGARAPGEIAHLAGIARPRIGVVTNTGTAHLGPFGGREAIRRAKAELVTALPADGVAILNADDPAHADMRRAAGARVLTFGVHAHDADLRVTEVRLDALARPAFVLTHAGRREPVRLTLSGAHQVDNAAAAAGAALALGLPLPGIARALSEAVRRTPSRMQVERLPDGALVLNDAFNANPDAVRAALGTLAAVAGTRPGGRAIAVLGEMRELGADSAALHREVGEAAAASGVGLLITVGDADAAHLAAGAARSGTEAVHVPTARAALALLGTPGPEDVLLVKGSRATGVEDVARALTARQRTPQVPERAKTG
ncbi:UDP-N-acetylmuramoyl-tripeptide--D-alanyl-D-alanine ligase (plasmid) [Streptomyces sp. BI20]|uniref:UDP-N-acetylmuramoyl-tripeptide--D-alanyl-D- alanine ligase n=1 Tax=Streptomyces sp. BI20 TaxID=3403460 RepID=UPI003C72EFD6